MKRLTIGENEQDQRLDRFLRKYLSEAPLSLIFKAIRKDVKVNGKRAKEDTMLVLGDELTIYLSDEDIEKFTAKKRRQSSKRSFKTVYEDDNILIVNKPIGILTHGDSKDKQNHLANQVIDYLIEKGDYIPRLEKTFSPAPVNRLDRNTSGLVIFCKNYKALKAFNRMIKSRGMIHKHYMTIVSGTMNGALELRNDMVKDDERNLVSIAEDGTGKAMVTFARPMLTSRHYSLAEVEIETGRTHQIRVQLANAGYPIIGDRKYGKAQVNRKLQDRYGLGSQLLHAYKLIFENLEEGFEYLNGKEFTAEPPKLFKKIQRDIFDGEY